ncbi:zf-HC2 domain-containing protein [Streptomyces sp. NPDC001985]|uniref:zf-HC2 domain-containing protein n=1 Tax=Streptomyces sp. NPDC001985 TaxID=3154406 RepID=UPI00332A9945
MSTQQHDSELLGAYVLGALDEGEARTVQEHVAACKACREELEVLTELEATLGEVPPEAFLDGPPEGGDLLLQRTLRQAREVRGGAERRRRAALAAVAVVAAVSVLGGGFLIGRGTDDAGRVTAGPTVTATPPVPAPPENVVVASAKDPGTGARMAVRMTPAAEWVRVNVAVSGIPAGERCRLVVVSRDGEREVAGSWLVGSAEKGANLDGSAAIAREDVEAVVVENEDGKRYVTAPIPA